MANSTFGITTRGAGNVKSSFGNKIQGYEFTCPSDGIANSIGIWIYADNTAHNGKGILYAGSDNSLVATTDSTSFTVGAAFALRTFNFSTKPVLTANTNYIICFWSDSANVTGSYTFSSGKTIRKDDETYNGAPDPFADEADTDTPSAIMHIYCNYTTGNNLSLFGVGK